MTVQAKFKVTSILQNINGNTVKLEPVTCGSEENNNFFKWTPYGTIEMGIVSDETIKQFVVGTEMYVTFSQAK